MARMQKTNRVLIVSLVAVAVIAAVLVGLYFGPAARESRGSDAAETVLIAFGENLKNVSFLSEGDVLTAAIEQNYGPYVTPELLADWKANPEHAPGRLTSSPWPERLVIGMITAQGESRIVTGEVILVTSTEESGETADTVPFVAQMIPVDGVWKIAAYQEERVQTLKNIPKTDEDIPGAR